MVIFIFIIIKKNPIDLKHYFQYLIIDHWFNFIINSCLFPFLIKKLQTWSLGLDVELLNDVCITF